MRKFWKLAVCACLAISGGPACGTGQSSPRSGQPAILAASPSSQAASAILPYMVYLYQPTYLVQSGLGVNLHVQLLANGLMSASDVAARVATAVSVSDSSGKAVPVQVSGAFGNNGATQIDIASVAPLLQGAWYSVVASSVPDSVAILGCAGFSLSVYTGDIVYIESVSQSNDPSKQDEVTLLFSQPVNFDASSSSHIFEDAAGNPISACLPSSGKCLTTGSMLVHGVSLSLSSGSGAKISRLVPAAMKAAYGHPGMVRPVFASSTQAVPDGSVQATTQPAPALSSSAATAQPLADGSLLMSFQNCKQGERCAFF